MPFALLALFFLSSPALAEPQSPVARTLFENLKSLMRAGTVLVGQQAATQAGAYPQPWSNDPNRSDIKALIGSHPALSGVDLWAFAQVPLSWGRPTTTAITRQFIKEGGLFTMDWHVRGCHSHTDAEGNIISGKTFYATAKEDDLPDNTSCFCHIVNTPYWQSWYVKQMDRVASSFQKPADNGAALTSPVIVRLFHEHTGDWFWWGEPYWNCSARLGDPNALSGPKAYKTLFRRTVDYLRHTKKLSNLLFAFSPDRLSSPTATNADGFRRRYNETWPGKAYVDIAGIDLYYQKESPNQRKATQRLFRTYLRTISSFAQSKGIVAALTEVGATDYASQPANWFTKNLLPLLTDPETQLAYVHLWANAANTDGKLWSPMANSPAAQDFKAFANSPNTLFLKDIPEIYTSRFNPPRASKYLTPLPCSDNPPDQRYTCAQQASWNKCSEPWMISGNYCETTCGRCVGP